MKAGEMVILEKIKELRHLLVLHCEKTHCPDMAAVCNAMVQAERLVAMVVDDADS
jgi:hypothetical protein